MTAVVAASRRYFRRGASSSSSRHRTAALLVLVASSLSGDFSSSAFQHHRNIGGASRRASTSGASCSPLPPVGAVSKIFSPSSSRARAALTTSAAAAAAAGRPTSLLSIMSSSSSWDDLRTTAGSLPVGSALNDEASLRSQGGGSAFVQNKLRLFDSASSSESKPPKITLYRDHAGWCPYCQKTMLLIEEKRIPIHIALVPMRSYGDKPQSFLDLVPSGLLPALVVEREDGSSQTITESQVIMELLDKWHPPSEGYKRMLPDEDDTAGWKKYDRLARLERELFSWWCTLIFRPEGPRMLGRSERDLSGAMKGFLECLDEVDAALTATPGPWFFSSKGEFPDEDYPTMMDFVYASHVERMLASCALWKGLDLRSDSSECGRKRFPGLNAWFDAFEQRDCYKAFQSDYYTHVMDIPPQYGPGYDGGFEDERKRIQGNIMGQDGKSWHLPLPHDDPVQPLYRGPPLPVCALEACGLSPDADGTGTYHTADPDVTAKACRHYAGWKLSSNGAAVAKFAARGGPKGGTNPRKGFGADLADPYAEPDVEIVPYVDAVLRIVCAGLLESGSESDGEHVQGLRADDVREAVPSKAEKRGDVAAALAYVRDRVGVPRDMPLAAARQFRAHLNWAIDALN